MSYARQLRFNFNKIMIKVLIIGAGGMLGHKLVQVFTEKCDVYTTIRNDFQLYEKINIFKKNTTFDNVNVENIERLKEIIKNIEPEVIVNAVGIIKQIPNGQNVIETLTVNSIFPHKLAEIAKETGSRLICISTDCVFSGKKGNYSEDDISDAYDLYGKSKNLGEIESENCLTIRTSIIGREIGTKHSLLEWFLSNRGKTVKGFKKAVFSGFPTIILAQILADIIVNHKNLMGFYHVASNPINKYDLLNLINDQYQADIKIEPDLEFEIDRSLNSTKFKSVTGFEPQSWQEMIKIMAEDPTNYADWKK
ncbi:NAD(P)-dependent oxidoreductase [soil metagenome]